MKKLITAILAVALILSSFSSAFAAVTISDIFVDEDGTHYFFGRFDYTKAEDAGIEVNGKDYNLNQGGMDYNDLPTALWASAKRNGRFGIGLKDSNGIIGNGTAEVKPYEIIDGEKVYGESVIFNGADSKTPVGDDVITSITVGEDVLKGVSSSISEYYYGLDILPEEAASLPTVTVATENEIISEETVSELGGFTRKITVKYNEKEYVYNIYFRKNETVTLTNTSLLSSKGGWVRNDKNGYAVINASEYGYAEFSTQALKDLDYVITGASLNANFKYSLEEFEIGVSAYDSADMLIGDVGEFLNRDFKNFRIAGSVTPTDNNTYYDTKLDYSKFRAEGDKIVLTFKKTGTATSYLYDPKLTITYVQKVPGLYDSTLKEVKIDGVSLEGFDPNKTEYYVGVENPEAVHEITAVPSYSESVVTVSGNTITVKPLVGESKLYTINFREIKTLTVTADEGGIIRVNGQIQQNSSGPQSVSPEDNLYVTYKVEQNYISYQEFDLSALTSNDIITGAEITADVFYANDVPANIYWYRSTFDTYASINVGGYHKEFSAHWTDARKPVQLGSFTIAEAVAMNNHVKFTSKLDASELNIVNNKVVLAATKGFGEENSTNMIYMTPKSTMTIKYVEKELGATDANLKEIKLDNIPLEGFNPNVTEYYVGIEPGAAIPTLTAAPSSDKSQVTVSGNTITVKPLVGESKVYTVNFREIKTLEVTASEGGIIRVNGQIQQGSSGPQSVSPDDNLYVTYKVEQNYISYQEFDLSALTSNDIITDAEITADVFNASAAPTNIYWHRSAFDTYASINVGGYHKEFSAHWTDARKPVQLGSFTIAEAVAMNNHVKFTSKLDANKLNIVNNKIVLAATKGFGEENSTNMIYMTPKSTMTIKYIEKTVSTTDIAD